MTRSPRCQTAIDYAKKAYLRLSHPYLTSAHLVLGLVTLSGGIGDTVLKRSGLSVDSIERFLSSRQIASEETFEQEGATLGHSTIDALNRAEQEAARFKHTILGVEHLTLSLLAEDHGKANDLFLSMPVSRERMREIILLEMK